MDDKSRDEYMVGLVLNLYPVDRCAQLIFRTVDRRVAEAGGASAETTTERPPLWLPLETLRQMRDDLSEAIDVLERNPGQGLPS